MALYTIGHSTHTIGRFRELLAAHHITHVLDVRAVPFSQHAPQFNGDVMPETLGGITYFPMGSYFGARPDAAYLYSLEGIVDFERVRCSARFRKGVKSVLRGLAQHNNIALMCAEKDPLCCHRAILVARAFELQNVDVQHILEDGRLLSQSQLNARLLNQYYPQSDSFMDSSAALLESAYRKQNARIGYRREMPETKAACSVAH